MVGNKYTLPFGYYLPQKQGYADGAFTVSKTFSSKNN